MKSKKILNQAILLVLGFIGMIAFGINWHFAIAAWLTPIFILRYTRSTKTFGFLLFLVVAILAAAIAQTCFVLVDMFILYLLNGVYFGITYSFPFLIDRLLYKKNKGFYTTLLYPSAVVFVEFFVRMDLGTWGAVAHTQYPFNSLIQFSSVTGLFGVSFLVSWFGSVVNWVIEKECNLAKTKKGIIIFGSIVLVVIFFGITRTTFFPIDSKTVKVAAISGDIDIHKLFEEHLDAIQRYAKGEPVDIPDNFYTTNKIVDLQLDKTEKAIREGAKIIAWNEISLILDKEQVDSLKVKIQEKATKNQVYIMLAYMEENSSEGDKPFNNKSVMITPDGKIAWEYKKSALHPEGEVPIINPGNFKIPFIDTEYGRLGAVICYDMEFPGFIKQAGERSVDIMLVPSYDWKEITPFHAQMASFEAIANGFSLLRPNGKGHSTAFDYHGKLIAQLNTFDTDERVLIAELPVKSVKTIYQDIGNLFAYLCTLVILIFLPLRFIRKKPS